MVVARLGLRPDALRGQTVIVTGAGGGIGYEAVRALLWLGADVVIAEVDVQSGSKAAETLGAQFAERRVQFIHTDVGDETSVQDLYDGAVSSFGKVDAVINNATVAVLGTVKDLPIEKWDTSYRVNLRGPVLMAKAFLPDMIRRNHGVFACVSSTGTAYLGGYETFKAAQVHLANTLDAELEGTGVTAFTIGPGLVPTDTAKKAISRLAPLMGMTAEEFFEVNKGAVLSVEEAGAGFAVSIVFAEKFRGQEISSMQALKAADIRFGSELNSSEESANQDAAGLDLDRRAGARVLCQAVLKTLQEQSDGWMSRSLFERQWCIRDFRKTAGMPLQEWVSALQQMNENLGAHTSAGVVKLPLEKLVDYYDHLAALAKGYEKDPARLEVSLRHIYGWKAEVEQLQRMIA